MNPAGSRCSEFDAPFSGLPNGALASTLPPMERAASRVGFPSVGGWLPVLAWMVVLIFFEAGAGAAVTINEFVPKGTEWVELHNSVGSGVISVAGWYLDDAACGVGVSTIPGGTNIADGGFFVVTAGGAGDNFALSNVGDFLVLCDNTGAEVDRVAYGTKGGAPVAPVGSSAARTADGLDTGVDAVDWNLDATPTQGVANDVGGTALGTSAILNEIDVFPDPNAVDQVELYNPGSVAVDLTGWVLSDGDELSPLAGGTVAPGGWLVLVSGVDFSGTMNFTGSDVAYLMDGSGVRVDQLGWSGGTETGCFSRLPDGAGPNDGYDWSSSGGGVTLVDQPCTMGGTNGGPTLLLSEIVVTPTGGEFIEIHNPTPVTISLDDLYLTDATYSTGGNYYYNIVTGSNAGGGDFGDFHARFPAGSSIAPGEYQTVSLAGSDAFLTQWGVSPTYELYEDGAADSIPDMREASAGSINNQGSLTNSGEVVILYRWNGVSDLVRDIDYAVWGDKVEAVDKTGVSVDGPDLDVTGTAYAADTAISSQDIVSTGAHPFGSSWHRIDLNEGTETKVAGNGVTGHDETSENLSATWRAAAVTPGQPAPFQWVVNEIYSDPITDPNSGDLIDPNAVLGDANGDGTRDGVADEFIELVNNTGAAADLSGWGLATGQGLVHTFPSGTVVPDGCALVLFGGGTPVGDFGKTTVQVASGGLGLVDGGDTISLLPNPADPNNPDVQVTFGAEALKGQSITLDPDITGSMPYVPHTTAGAGPPGVQFSPGTQSDGVPFAGCPAPERTLQLSELVVSQDSGQFVEIHNPTTATIDLTDVYLTDATYSSGGDYYYNIVTADCTGGGNVAACLAGGGSFRDFHAKFPSGATIASGDFQTVAVQGALDFQAVYGSAPTYELYGTDPNVPDMLEAFSGSIDLPWEQDGSLDSSGLSGGEVMVLYQWDGQSDLVVDLDYAVWGDKAEAVDKTGISVDGPDGDTAATSYLADTVTASQDVISTSAHSAGKSFQRIDPWEGNEVPYGGNGLRGNDETSEDLSVTWDSMIPTPGRRPPMAVLNEIHSAPDPNAGDANGDGTVDAAQDEFLELVNDSGVDINLDGWVVQDAAATRHVFPPGSFLPDQCSVLVFGGGTPDPNAFGGALVQTASTGGLGLDDAGDTLQVYRDPNDPTSNVVDVTYGAEAANGDSITLDPDILGSPPYVQHSQATGSGGSRFSPGVRIDGTSFSGCVALPELKIYEVQGAASKSPYIDRAVVLKGNLVTAVAADGFYIQTPDGTDDGDPATSEGLFVFTEVAPSVTVGDEVDVTGLVDEYYSFTEITRSPVVTVVSSGNPLPAAVVFDGTTPASSPADPPPLERFEGMLVQVTDGIVSGASNRYGDFMAVAPGRARALREAGIEYPGLTGIPVWDGNPELFELDPNALGLPMVEMSAGDTFTAEGPLGFVFGDYQIQPKSLSVSNTFTYRAVRDRLPGEFTLATLNTEFLRNTETDRLKKFSKLVLDVLKAPDILAIEEVQDQATLDALVAQIATEDPNTIYTSHLMDSPNAGSQQVGFLTKGKVSNIVLSQFGLSDTFDLDGQTYDLYDRVPLVLEGQVDGVGTSFSFTAIAVHLRSFIGVDSSEFARQKRLEQATRLSQYIQSLQTADPNMPIIVLGDFNAFEFSDGYYDVVGQIRGLTDPNDSVIPVTDEVTPDMTNQVLNLALEERYSWQANGSAQVLDHILTSESMAQTVTGIEFGRVNADAPDEGSAAADPNTPVRASDHDPLVLFVQGEEYADLEVTSVSTTSPAIAGSAVTYTVTVTNNGPRTASGGSLSGALPNGLTFVAPVRATSASCSESGGLVTCDLGDIPSGSAISVDLDALLDSSASSLADMIWTVTSSTRDQNSANDSGTGSIVVTTSADLSVSVADDLDPAAVGGKLNYTATVTNGGPSDASGVTLEVTLDGGLTLVSALGCTDNSGTLTCDLGSLASLQTAIVMVETTVSSTAVTPLSTSFVVTAVTDDPDSGNGTWTEATDLLPSVGAMSEALLLLALLLLLVGAGRIIWRRHRVEA